MHIDLIKHNIFNFIDLNLVPEAEFDYWHCLSFYLLLVYPGHSGWTQFYFMRDPKCSKTFPSCTIRAQVAFAWRTYHFLHKVEFTYIGWNGVNPLVLVIKVDGAWNTLLIQRWRMFIRYRSFAMNNTALSRVYSVCLPQLIVYYGRSRSSTMLYAYASR